MPNSDGTGPAGMGSMTGRGAGYCAGSKVSGYANTIGSRGYDYGFGFGRGGGCGRSGCRGHRNRYYTTGLTGRQQNAVDHPAK